MKQHGFSLLELIVDIAILGTLLLLLYFLIDPIAQLEKAHDATRKHDLLELQNALDTYYNDTGCYPTSLQFGTEWRDGSTVYMREVPQDSSCRSNPSQCYVYQVDTSNACPQWNILYAKQETSTSQTCSLSSISTACLPPNYDDTYACAVSGNVDCEFVSSSPLVPSTPNASGNGGNPYPSYAPTSSESCPQSERHYSCTGGPTARCNVVPAGTGTYCSSNCEGAC